MAQLFSRKTLGLFALFALLAAFVAGQHNPVNSTAAASRTTTMADLQTDTAVVALLESGAATFAAEDEKLCFAETGKCLSKAFLYYWRTNGGLSLFGLPLIDERMERLEDGKVYNIQILERARFEYHDNLKGTPYEVSLGQFGRLVLGLTPEGWCDIAGKRWDMEFDLTQYRLWMSDAMVAALKSQGGECVLNLQMTRSFILSSVAGDIRVDGDHLDNGNDKPGSGVKIRIIYKAGPGNGFDLKIKP